MKTHLIRCGVILTIATLLLSIAVLAGPKGPPADPGGVCAVVRDLPIPQPVITRLLELLGCACLDGSVPPPPCVSY